MAASSSTAPRRTSCWAETMNADELKRRQRAKNIAMAAGLFALVLLFYLITLVKLGGA